jgi:hypothetical protein
MMAPADWGRANEVEEVKEGQPLASIPLAIATLLAILGSAAHIPTMHPVGVTRGGCQGACADSVAQTVPISAETATTVRQKIATTSLPSPGLGRLAAVHGPARARSVTPSHPMSPTVSATQLSHLHRGVLQAPLVLLQEPQAQS